MNGYCDFFMEGTVKNWIFNLFFNVFKKKKMGAFYGETKSFILEKKKKITKNDHKAHDKKKKRKQTRKLGRLDNNNPIIFSYHLLIVKIKKKWNLKIFNKLKFDNKNGLKKKRQI